MDWWRPSAPEWKDCRGNSLVERMRQLELICRRLGRIDAEGFFPFFAVVRSHLLRSGAHRIVADHLFFVPVHVPPVANLIRSDRITIAQFDFLGHDGIIDYYAVKQLPVKRDIFQPNVFRTAASLKILPHREGKSTVSR